MKTILKSVIITFALTLCCYGIYQIYLAKSLNEVFKQASKREIGTFYKEHFEGKIYFSNSQKLSCILFGDIFLNNKQYRTLQLCPCHNQEFEKFISEKDSIIKVSNSKKVTIINDRLEAKEFEMPFCK